MAEKSARTVAEVFAAFLKLGLTSFGGPIAHLGYFRTEFVERRKWLSESSYADIVALCQFLPGPASSQVGFTLGILRGNGLLGGLAAWFAFTMPSAIILFAFALGATAFTSPVAEGILHGLKLVAVAVVAQAIWGMANSLTPDRARAAIALAAVAIVVFIGGSFGQISLHVGQDWHAFLNTSDEHSPILDVAAGSTTVTFSIADRKATDSALEFARELASQAADFAAEVERLHAQHSQDSSTGDHGAGDGEAA